MKQLWVGERQAGLAGLLDFHVFLIYMRQSKKDDPGKIALHARLFCDRFAQINREAESHSGAVFRPPLPLAVDLPGFLLDHQWLPFRDCARILPPPSWASRVR